MDIVTKRMSLNPKCDICKGDIELEFVDGKTRMGPWANMCMDCHQEVGFGLGIGRGQKYKFDAIKDVHTIWIKVEG